MKINIHEQRLCLRLNAAITLNNFNYRILTTLLLTNPTIDYWLTCTILEYWLTWLTLMLTLLTTQYLTIDSPKYWKPYYWLNWLWSYPTTWLLNTSLLTTWLLVNLTTDLLDYWIPDYWLTWRLTYLTSDYPTTD